MKECNELLRYLFNRYVNILDDVLLFRIEKHKNLKSVGLYPSGKTTSVAGIDIPIYNIKDYTDEIVGEIKFTEEGICFCVDKKYESVFFHSV